MKKLRAMAAVLTAVIIAVCFAVPAHASQVYFTAVNNTLLDLNASTMPIVDGGFVYLPYSIFNDSSLGTVAVYSKDSKTAAIYGYSTKHEMYFNLGNDTTYDEEDRSYSVTALYRNGTAYVPAAFVCQYFGLNYSYITDSEVAVIIRIKVDGMLDDYAFATAATSRMRIALAEYESENAATPTVSPSTSPTSSPKPPATQAPNYPDYSGVEVRLAFYGLDPELTPQIVNSFGKYGFKACFFVSAEDIAAYPELPRMLIGEGHQLGLLSDGDNYRLEWNEAASALRAAAMTKTLLAATRGGPDGSLTAVVEKLGLILCFDGEMKPMSAENSFYEAGLIESMQESEQLVQLVFETDEESVSELNSLLYALKIGKYNVVQIKETLYGE